MGDGMKDNDKNEKRPITVSEIIGRRRMQRCEDLLLQGMTNQSQIAIALGCTQANVSIIFKKIRETWLKQDVKSAGARRREYVRRFHNAAYEAFKAWERSKQSTEEITTDYRKVKCPVCKGSGMTNETDWCEECNGDGTKTVEHVTRKIRGQAGDAAHLRVFKEMLVEAAKIECVYPSTIVNVKTRNRTDIHFGIEKGTDFSTAPLDALLDARKAIANLMNTSQTVDVIDVDPEMVREDPSENGNGNGKPR